jgi:hypothetical protein
MIRQCTTQILLQDDQITQKYKLWNVTWIRNNSQICTKILMIKHVKKVNDHEILFWYCTTQGANENILIVWSYVNLISLVVQSNTKPKLIYPTLLLPHLKQWYESYN